jgi:hypothetical protein
MSKIIAASIDVMKIDKSRIVEGKNGAKYYNISIILNDEKDTYGNDCAITEGQTKEERAAKTKAKYIGNGKVVYDSVKGVQPTSQPSVSQSDNDDLPF